MSFFQKFKNVFESKEVKQNRLNRERRQRQAEAAAENEGLEFPELAASFAPADVAAVADVAEAEDVAAAQKQKLLEIAAQMRIDPKKINMILDYLTKHGFTEEEANVKIRELFSYVPPSEIIDIIFIKLTTNKQDEDGWMALSSSLQIDQNVQTEAMKLEKEALSKYITHMCKKKEYIAQFDTKDNRPTTREKRKLLYEEIEKLGQETSEIYGRAVQKYKDANDTRNEIRVHNLTFSVRYEVFRTIPPSWMGDSTPAEIAGAEASIAAINAKIAAGLPPRNRGGGKKSKYSRKTKSKSKSKSKKSKSKKSKYSRK